MQPTSSPRFGFVVFAIFIGVNTPTMTSVKPPVCSPPRLLKDEHSQLPRAGLAYFFQHSHLFARPRLTINPFLPSEGHCSSLPSLDSLVFPFLLPLVLHLVYFGAGGNEQETLHYIRRVTCKTPQVASIPHVPDFISHYLHLCLPVLPHEPPSYFGLYPAHFSLELLCWLCSVWNVLPLNICMAHLLISFTSLPCHHLLTEAIPDYSISGTPH